MTTIRILSSGLARPYVIDLPPLLPQIMMLVERRQRIINHDRRSQDRLGDAVGRSLDETRRGGHPQQNPSVTG
ncbi:hypothetical protein [Mesorhizobium sp.]|uniref:hypothetical protein n=1 Tax=Mesorhizobium sp. TaxID=1871066 RepID=UPI0025EC1C1E|nr:hypothetical protein [Mesorhizobium sp.]